MGLAHTRMGVTHTRMGLTPLHMGGFLFLKLIDNHTHLCIVVRGMCPCVLVRKCVIERERERYGLNLVNHTYAHTFMCDDTITNIRASK